MRSLKKAALVLFIILLLQVTLYLRTVFSQELNTKETSYVTANFEGILHLEISSNPEVEFDFKSVDDYQKGITRYNAVTLRVDATTDWDLYAYATTDEWKQVSSYSLDGETGLPAEILEIQS